MSLKKTGWVFLFSFGFLLWSSPLRAEDWPQLKGQRGGGVSEDTGFPIHWSKTANLRWKVDLPGRGLSSPIIAAGRVYLTACSGPDQQRLHVLCFEAATGKKLWERQLWATGTTLCHPKTNMAAPTPVTDGKRVYALFATCDLVCLDAQGDLVWYRSLTRDYPTMGNNVGMAASPVLAKGSLILALENAGESYTLGLDKLTGKNRWQVDRDREINWVTPLLFNNKGREEVLIQSPRELTALDPETGRKLWRHSGVGLSTIPSPVQGGGVIFATGGGIVALRPGGDGMASKVIWTKAKLATSFASPLYYRGALYAVNNVGVLTCADSATGNILWQLRLKGAFSASPVAAEGRIYLVNESASTFVVQSGKTGKLIATNELAATVLATPALADGAIYLRSDQVLYCFKAKK
jgi:outer membrane protein assembly factor BamB